MAAPPYRIPNGALVELDGGAVVAVVVDQSGPDVLVSAGLGVVLWVPRDRITKRPGGRNWVASVSGAVHCDGCANGGRRPTTPIAQYQWIEPGAPIYDLCEECAALVGDRVLRG
jgi:hypothetical protein